MNNFVHYLVIASLGFMGVTSLKIPELHAAPVKGDMATPKDCFVLNNQALVVGRNLYQSEEDVLIRTRFTTENAYYNYILFNSIRSTFSRCLFKQTKFNNFTSKVIKRDVIQYTSTKTQWLLISPGEPNKYIYKRIVITVDYTNPKVIKINVTSPPQQPQVGKKNRLN